MNIYLITEDGQPCCIKAARMADAIRISCELYIQERIKEEDEPIDIDGEIAFYHRAILESCQLIGELKN